MADSKGAIFFWAAVGNTAPLFLRWYGEERIFMPGETIGGLLAFLVFALLAGGVATFVWKERTTRRAFIVGLVFPYVLWGALADIQDVVKVKRARGQTVEKEQSTGRTIMLPIEEKLTLRESVSVLKFNVIDDSGTTPAYVKARMTAADKDTTVTVEQPREVVLQPGNYRVTVWAPGYKMRTLDISLGASEAKPVDIQLQKPTFGESVWDGFSYMMFPRRRAPGSASPP